jgi:hypothetical protein
VQWYVSKVGESREALHPLRLEVAVGHRMAHRHHAQASVEERPADLARGLALPAARAHGADADDGHARLEHRAASAEQDVVRSARDRPRSEVHDVTVRDVAVGEDHLVDVQVADELLEVLLGMDRDALGIAGPREPGG